MSQKQWKSKSDDKSKNDDKYSEIKSQVTVQVPTCASSEIPKIYTEFFRMDPPSALSKQQVSELKRESISYNKNCFQPTVSMVITYEDPSSQILKLAISISYFMIEITVLNSSEESITNTLKNIGKGSYSSIYEYELEGQIFAVKSVNYSMQGRTYDHKERTLQKVIIEYSLSKLFCCLKMGPKILPTLGFDLIIYKNNVEFSMESCKKCDRTRIQELKSDLLLMHSLNIIHGDIKPDNIMWSQTYHKNVFIDFGMTNVVKENIWQSTLTHYFGTYNYCCESMRKLLFGHKIGYVNLYLNDLYGFKKVLFKEQKQTEYQFEVQNIFPKSKHQNELLTEQKKSFLKNIFLMSLIYFENFDQLTTFVRNNPNLIVMDSTYQLMKSRIDSPQFKKMHKKLLSLGLISNQKTQQQNLFYINEAKNCESEKQKRRYRIRELCDIFEGTVNDLMLFMMIYYQEDVTPAALKRSTQLKEWLQNNQHQNLQFWQKFIQYINNPYVTVKDTMEMFSFVGNKLDIRSWNQTGVEQVKPFDRARNIAEVVLKKYQINLFDLQYKTSKVPYNEYDFSKLEKKFDLSNNNDFPYIDFLKRFFQLLSKRQRQDEFEQCFYRAFQQIGKTYTITDLPFLMFLIKEKIHLQRDFLSKDIKQRAQKFFDYFKYFKPAMKKYPFLDNKRKLLMNDTSSYHAKAYYQLSLQIFKDASSPFFMIKQSINFYFYAKMLQKWSKPLQIVKFFQNDIHEMYDYLLKFNSYNLLYEFTVSFAFVHSTIYHEYNQIYNRTLVDALRQEFIEILRFILEGDIMACCHILQIYACMYEARMSNGSSMDITIVLEACKKLEKQINKMQIQLVMMNTNALQRVLRHEGAQQISYKFYSYIVDFVISKRTDLLKNYRFLSTLSQKIALSIKLQKQKQKIKIQGELLISILLELIKDNDFEVVKLLKYIIRVIGIYLVHFPEGELDFFFTLLKIKDTSLQFNYNFYYYQVLIQFVRRFFSEKNPHYGLKIKQTFQFITAKFKQNSELFCKHYSNCLFLIEQFFQYFLNHDDPKKYEIINKCLLIASLIVNSNRCFITRNFISHSPNWKRLLSDKEIIQVKNNFRTKIIIFLRSTRSNKLFSKSNYIQIPHILKIKIDQNSLTKKISHLFFFKLKQMIENKIVSTMKAKMDVNILTTSKRFYYDFINYPTGEHFFQYGL